MTSSAWFQPGDGTRPALVIFGGGYTLYALERRDRRRVLAARLHRATRADPRPRRGRHPHLLLAGGGRGQGALRGRRRRSERATAATSWAPASPPGTRSGSSRPTSTARGHMLNNGCGSVWSSGTVLPALGLVVFGTADCDFSNDEPLSESILALHISDRQAGVGVPPSAARPRVRLGLRRHGQRRRRRPGESPPSSARGQGRHVLLARSGDRCAAVVDQRGLRWVLRRVHRHDRLRRPAGLRLHRPRRLRAIREGHPGLANPSNPRD